MTLFLGVAEGVNVCTAESTTKGCHGVATEARSLRGPRRRDTLMHTRVASRRLQSQGTLNNHQQPSTPHLQRAMAGGAASMHPRDMQFLFVARATHEEVTGMVSSLFVAVQCAGCCAASTTEALIHSNVQQPQWHGGRWRRRRRGLCSSFYLPSRARGCPSWGRLSDAVVALSCGAGCSGIYGCASAWHA